MQKNTLNLMRGGNGYHRTIPDSPRRHSLNPMGWPKLSKQEKQGLHRAFIRAILNKSVVHPKGRVPRVSYSGSIRELTAPTLYYPGTQPQFGQHKILERYP